MPSRRALTVALTTAAILSFPSTAAAFATIPEDDVFAREGRRELIHVRIQEGCVDAATDRVEVEIPEGVLAVIPQAVPGWTATTETIETEPYEIFGQSETDRVSRVLWTGGPLAADQFQDFGIAAVFTEPTPELVLPVVQGCGEVEQAWEEVPEEGEDRGDLQFPAPVVSVVEPPDTDIPGLQADLSELRTELEELRTEFDGLRLSEIPGTRLRERLDDLESRIVELEDQ
jgi:periplasmic copper chaperone A